MYDSFYKHIEDEVARQPVFYAYGYNGVQLLTCFDSYLESKKKIMCFGERSAYVRGQID